MSETITFANPKLAKVSANARKKKTGGKKMADNQRKISAAARKKLSAAAKRRPRIKTGPRKGQFLKGPRRKTKKKSSSKSKNVIAKRPKSDPNPHKAKPKAKAKPNRMNPADANRARSLLNERKDKIEAAELAAGTGLREFGSSLMRSTLPVLSGVVAFRADEWFTDDLTRLVGVEQHSAAGKAIRAVVAIALGMGIDLLVRRDGKALEIRMTSGEFIRNLLLVKLISEVSADLIEPGVFRLKNVPGLRLIATPATQQQAAAAETAPAQIAPAPAAGGAGFGRAGFPAGSIRTRRPNGMARRNGMGVIMRVPMGAGVPGEVQF